MCDWELRKDYWASEGSPWPSLSLFTVCLPRLDSCGRPSPAGVLSDEKGQPEQVFKNPSV